MQDQNSIFAAAFVVTYTITICVTSMASPGKLPLWASCLVMMVPLLPFAASMLHLPDLTPKLHPIESLYLEGKRHHEAMLSASRRHQQKQWSKTAGATNEILLLGSKSG